MLDLFVIVLYDIAKDYFMATNWQIPTVENRDEELLRSLLQKQETSVNYPYPELINAMQNITQPVNQFAQDYIVDPLNKLGGGTGDSLKSLVNFLPELSFGADVRDATQGSNQIVEGIKNKDIGEALEGAAYMLAGVAGGIPVYGDVAKEAAQAAIPFMFGTARNLNLPKVSDELVDAVSTRIGPIDNYDERFRKAGAGSAAKGKAAIAGVGAGDPRAGDVGRLEDLSIQTANNRMPEIPTQNLTDLEGRPFIISMSDRSHAGDELVGVNNVMFDSPVNRRGGQDYMFDPLNEGQVWASDKKVITGGPSKLANVAEELKRQTGQNPLFMPWTMAPTGGDFATMTSDTMLSYARQNMPMSEINRANNEIREVIPEWVGIENPASSAQLSEFGGQKRFKIMSVLDKGYRDLGSLTTGEARLAVSDLSQINTPDGMLRNIGEILADRPVIDVSGHPTYNTGLAGQGLGRLDRPIQAWEMMPETAQIKGVLDPKNPTRKNIRPLEMKGYTGIIDEALLRRLGY